MTITAGPPTKKIMAFGTLLKLDDHLNGSPIMEGENIIGVKENGGSLTLEPGGQFELSRCTFRKHFMKLVVRQTLTSK